MHRLPISMRSLHKTDDVMFSVMLWPVESDLEFNRTRDELDNDQKGALQSVWHQFADVFAEIQSLPLI